jgi:hypothetical protein
MPEPDPATAQHHHHSTTVEFHMREGKTTREAPACRIFSLNVAHSAWNDSESTEKLPLTGFLPLKAVPLFEVLLHQLPLCGGAQPFQREIAVSYSDNNGFSI